MRRIATVSLSLWLSVAASAGCTDDGPDPKALCLEFATAIADACRRCSASSTAWNDCYAPIADACGEVETIRDAESFEQVCLPLLENIACSTLRDPDAQVPESCDRQFWFQQ